MGRKRPFGFPEFGLDDGFFEEFGQIEEMMRQMLESHFKDFDEKALEAKLPQPRVYGFTLSFGSEGKNKLKQFGLPAQKQVQAKGMAEPVFELMEKPDSITIVAELPGVEPKDLQLRAFPNQLSIRVNDPERLLSKTFALPAEVVWDSVKHSLKNGILEIVLKKRK